MAHLPAYIALLRFAEGRVVVVIEPATADGPQQFVHAGARRVVVVSQHPTPNPGVEVRAGMPVIPLADASVDLVVCLEGYGELEAELRLELLAEARRVLRPSGMWAALAPQSVGAEVDYWTLQDELAPLFQRVCMVAQMPWEGFSLAPVLEEEPGIEPHIVLEERLLDGPPQPSHYLALAWPVEPAAHDIERITAECLLVPVPGGHSLGHPRLREALVELQQDYLGARERIDALDSEAAEHIRELEAARGEILRLEELVGALEDERRAHAEHRGLLSDDATRGIHPLERRSANRDDGGGDGDDVDAERAGAVRSRDATLDHLLESVAVLEQELTEARNALDGARRLQHELEVSEHKRRSLEDVLARERTLSQATHGQIQDELEQLRDERRALKQALTTSEGALRAKDTDLAVLTRTVSDLEKSLGRVQQRADTRSHELDLQRQAHNELKAKHDALQRERDHLDHALELAMQEREGARQASVRAQTELELGQRHLQEQDKLLTAKREEASTLAAEARLLRERVTQQEAQLDRLRSREEELTASVAHHAEKGRMISEVAADRDRLREELSRRSSEIAKLEERLWDAQESLQKTRVDKVRLEGELERLRDEASKSRDAEGARAKELERLNGELRRVELERAELLALARARADEVERLRREAADVTAASGDVATIRRRLEERGDELAALRAELAQARAREADAIAMSQRHAAELAKAVQEGERLRNANQSSVETSATLENELAVAAVEVDQLQARVRELGVQLEAQRKAAVEHEAHVGVLQQQVEAVVAEQDALVERLRERERELEEVISARDAGEVELLRLRRDLEADTRDASPVDAMSDWPQAAVAEVQRLRAQLAAALPPAISTASESQPEIPNLIHGKFQARIRRLELEIEVRAEEQEYVLSQLDAAEQRIWEMSDAADRNAARFAASLAQLEKHKDQLDETLDELEVTRRLLAASQARALEQERLLASERAKLARAGIGSASEESSMTMSETVDDLFAELGVEQRAAMTSLEAPEEDDAGAIPTPIRDRSGRLASEGTFSESRSSARLVVEPIDPDAEWPEDDATPSHEAAEWSTQEHTQSWPMSDDDADRIGVDETRGKKMA